MNKQIGDIIERNRYVVREKVTGYYMACDWAYVPTYHMGGIDIADLFVSRAEAQRLIENLRSLGEIYEIVPVLTQTAVYERED
jgi:hypothetical protein